MVEQAATELVKTKLRNELSGWNPEARYGKNKFVVTSINEIFIIRNTNSIEGVVRW